MLTPRGSCRVHESDAEARVAEQCSRRDTAADGPVVARPPGRARRATRRSSTASSASTPPRRLRLSTQDLDDHALRRDRRGRHADAPCADRAVGPRIARSRAWRPRSSAARACRVRPGARQRRLAARDVLQAASTTPSAVADRIRRVTDVTVRSSRGSAHRRRAGERAAVHARVVRPARDGDVHRGRRLRRRRARRARRARPARLRPQRRGHAQLRRRRARHPQLDLRLPRRGHPQHPRLPGRLPGRGGRQARAELPLDADHPRRRQRGHLPQPRADGQDALDRHRRGRPDQDPRARRRARRGAVRRRRDRAARRRGRVARRDRGLLPDQRAVPGARGHARPRARSATRSSAARSSTSARRSRTRSPT